MKKEDNLKANFMKNSFWSLIVTILNRTGGLIFTVILARILLPETYGMYSIVLSIAMIFYTFTDLGVSTALLKYVSHSMERDRKKLYPYYIYLLKIKFFLTLGASGIMLFSAYIISHWLFNNPALFLPIVISAVYIFVLSFETFYTQLFLCLEKVQYMSIKEVFNQILRISLIGIFLIIVPKSIYLSGVFSILTFISLLMLGYAYYYTKKLLPALYDKSNEQIDKKRVLKFVGFLTIASISGVFFSYIDSIILAIFVTPEYVGYYRAAFSLIFGITGLLGFFGPLMVPFFSKMKFSKKSRTLNNMFKYVFILIVPATFGLIALGNYFIRIFYGYAYLPATLPLYILSILIVPSIIINMILMLFSSEERPDIFARLIFITSILNILLNFIFIKTFITISPLAATAGAATATVLSYIFYFFGSIYYLKKEFKISASFKTISKPIIASLVMSIGIIFAKNSMGDMTLVTGGLVVLLGLILYFLSLFLIKGFVKEDIALILSLLRSKPKTNKTKTHPILSQIGEENPVKV